jgi:hypothetical protein
MVRGAARQVSTRGFRRRERRPGTPRACTQDSTSHTVPRTSTTCSRSQVWSTGPGSLTTWSPRDCCTTRSRRPASIGPGCGSLGERVAALVGTVTEDDAIAGDAERKAELRARVARADEDVLTLFAADKVSKVRELARGRFAGSPAGPQPDASSGADSSTTPRAWRCLSGSCPGRHSCTGCAPSSTLRAGPPVVPARWSCEPARSAARRTCAPDRAIRRPS